MKDVWIHSKDATIRNKVSEIAEKCGGEWYGRGYNLVKKIYDASFHFKKKDYKAFLNKIRQNYVELGSKIGITANGEEVILC